MTKTTFFILVILLASCKDEWSDQIVVNPELTNFNTNPFVDTSRSVYGDHILNSDFEIIQRSYSKTHKDTLDSKELLGSCFCYLENDTLQIYLGRQHMFGGEWIYNKIDKRGHVTSIYSQTTDTYIAERDRYQIDFKRIELNKFPVREGDTLIGNMSAKHDLEFEDWEVQWTATGNFKCIVIEKPKKKHWRQQQINASRL